MMPEHRIHADGRDSAMPHSTIKTLIATKYSVVITLTRGCHVPANSKICKNVLSMQHQPEAFASDLGDDQSRYLFVCCTLCAKPGNKAKCRICKKWVKLRSYFRRLWTKVHKISRERSRSLVVFNALHVVCNLHVYSMFVPYCYQLSR